MSQKKPWFRSTFSQDTITTQPPAKKTRSSSFSYSSDLSKKLDKSISNKEEFPPINNLYNSSNWIEKFAPNCIEDLAVHAKKILEVQDWLKHYETVKQKTPGQILLITGPAGSGKTATLKVIGKEMQFGLVEWITPVDIDLQYDNPGFNNDENITYKESQTDIFKRFLFCSSRYKSILESNDRRLVLVEDFPNVFIRNSEGFNEILENYVSYGKSPLVFIITDSRSRQLNIAYNLFPEKVRNEFNITQISFNPASTTLIKKALKRICTKMLEDGFKKFYKVPNQDVIDSINIAAQGDVRNAIINLHFASQKGAPNLQTEETSKNSSTTNKSKSKTKKLKTVGRDETITMMHALGRVFNPKYIEDIIPKKLTYSPEEITDGFSSQPKQFVGFLHSNYLPHFRDIESVLEAIDTLSQSDLLMNEYRENEISDIGLNIAIRGIMVTNIKPVTGWMPIRGIKKDNQRTNQDYNEFISKSYLSKNLFASDYRSYLKIIKENQKNQK